MRICFRQVDSAKTAFAQLSNDAVFSQNRHARPEVDDLTEQRSMGRAGLRAIGKAGIALRAEFHA